MKTSLLSIFLAAASMLTAVNPLHAQVNVDPAAHQMGLRMRDGDMKYFNTADINSVVIDGDKITVNPKSSASLVFDNQVGTMKFRKAEAIDAPAITNPAGKVQLLEARGWHESAYVTWTPYEGATDYSVYVRGGQYTDWTVIDAPLVRDYGSYARADVVGLKAGEYALRVVPVKDETPLPEASNEVDGLKVINYDRAGYAHMNFNDGVGAYNNDGTLKTGARVIYVTGSNAKTITLDVVTGNNDKKETFTGLQAIINAYQKGLETRPLDVRLLGTIHDTDMDQLGSKEEGLQIKGKNNSVAMNITLEGIGDDAAIMGFGMLLRNAVSVELRNFAVIHCMDDCISVDTDNKNCWIHHIDLFYGNPGSDSDQAKGDGSIDIKGNSTMITVAYCHFFDCGKTSLCGMKSESAENLICYHHNWFDHSDSRHPRIRTSTVHIWNNYYDGCSKYGAGATSGCSAFVESNYFRATKRPMMSSKQGTDATGDGTFSGEDGGIIKSFGNIMAQRGKNFSYITWADNHSSFDAYEASSRDEQVPATVVTLAGGTSYNNFDTDPARIYGYTPLDAEDVPAVVMGYYGAGRLNHGDIAFKFDDAVDDDDYSRNTALDAVLNGYSSKLVGHFTPLPGSGIGGGEEPDPGVDPDPAVPEGSVVVNFIGKKPSEAFVSVSGNYSDSKGTATYGGTTYIDCVKLETATNITVSLGDKKYKVTLVFGDTETGSIKVDGVKKTSAGSTLEIAEATGTLTLTKADSRNLFLIVLEEVTTDTRIPIVINPSVDSTVDTGEF